MIRCIRCNRPINSGAATAGALAWGPKCARIAGLIKPKRKHHRVIDAYRPLAVDRRQMALELAA